MMIFDFILNIFRRREHFKTTPQSPLIHFGNYKSYQKQYRVRPHFMLFIYINFNIGVRPHFISVESSDEEVCVFDNVTHLAQVHNTIKYEILTNLKPSIKRVIIN
jgi:hypothetical protein